MRAVVLREYGPRENLRVEELAEPALGPGEVLVELAASGLNRLDVFVRQGLSGPGVRHPRALPHVMGAEGAGVVLETAPDAETDLRPGDRVMVFSGLSCERCRYCRRGETSRCAEYAILGEDVWGLQRQRLTVPASALVRAPEHLSLEEAAAAQTAYTTAWTMLITSGRLRLGERVLVVGASGGVATAAIQLAAQAGAEVLAATRGPAKARRIAALPGVRHVIDSSLPEWHRQVLEVTDGQGVDMAVDSSGAATWRESIRSLATGGRMTICGATGGDTPDISIRELYQAHRRIIGAPYGGWNDFVDVVEMIRRTRIKPLLHAVIPMSEVAEAHRLLEESEQIGKVVLSLGDP